MLIWCHFCNYLLSKKGPLYMKFNADLLFFCLIVASIKMQKYLVLTSSNTVSYLVLFTDHIFKSQRHIISQFIFLTTWSFLYEKLFRTAIIQKNLIANIALLNSYINLPPKSLLSFIIPNKTLF